ncbi:MAG: AAA family ATPase [Planctomycetes bacterium]|nr:AAA family ATPase [Planctomycetota bacterium]
MNEPQGLWKAQLATAAKPVSWLWEGYAAPGQITLLTSQWKSGKTTLLSLLLARRIAGGTLAGRAVAPGGTIIVSEESATLWGRREQKLGFGDNNCFFCRPYGGKPSFEQWLDMLGRLERLHQEHGLNLAIIDSLTSLLPVRDENRATPMVEALDPLRRLTEKGLASILVHHPKKGVTIEGQAARGTGALTSFVDITLEMARPRSGGERRRRLVGHSRFEETPAGVLMELEPDGRDYRVLDESLPDDFTANWDYLRMVLEDADDKYTRSRILEDWPADFPKPSPVSLWRWLERAAAENRVCREGTGRKRKPFRYWLPAKEAQWRSDPLWQLERQIDEIARKSEETNFGIRKPAEEKATLK